MYAIEDEETGRFLSWRSVSTGIIDNEILYITYTGKLGTDFFTSLIEAEKQFVCLYNRIQVYGVTKLLQIVMVNPDELELGKRVIELLLKDSLILL